MKRFQKILFAALLAVAPLAVCAQTAKTHTVQRGETFALVAKRYGLTEQELKTANPDEDICYAGLKLKIPAKAMPKVMAPTTSTPSNSSVAATLPSQDYPAGTTNTPAKKKKSFWKKLGTGALVVAGVAAGVAVGVAASKAGGGSSGGTYASGVMSATDDVSSSAPSGRSQSYYQSMYDRWKSKAEKTYKDGKRHKESTDRGTSRMASADARVLRTQQKAMRQARLQAQKEGFTISQSVYETVSF